MIKPDHKVNLRKLAAGQTCQVRLTEIGCTMPDNDCVLAHLQYPAGIRGMGQKAPDLLATYACTTCHNEIDRRTTKLERDYVRMAAYEGVIRTQLILIRAGIITW